MFNIVGPYRKNPFKGSININIALSGFIRISLCTDYKSILCQINMYPNPTFFASKFV